MQKRQRNDKSERHASVHHRREGCQQISWLQLNSRVLGVLCSEYGFMSASSFSIRQHSTRLKSVVGGAGRKTLLKFYVKRKRRQISPSGASRLEDPTSTAHMRGGSMACRRDRHISSFNRPNENYTELTRICYALFVTIRSLC